MHRQHQQQQQQQQQQQPRRRSYDGHFHSSSATNTANNTNDLLSLPKQRRPSPVPSVSLSATPTSSSHHHHHHHHHHPHLQHYQKHLDKHIPFPRGGRHIDENEAAEQQQPTPKKRHLFGRFGKKKSSSSSSQHDSSNGSAVTASSSSSNNTPHINVRNDSLNTTASSSAASTLSLASSSLSTASTLVPPLHHPQQQRKGSSHSDHHHYHMLDTASMFSEYKKSTTSTLGRKGKEASHRHYPRRSIKEIELDQNFGCMDGIVNPDYYTASTITTSTASIHPTEQWDESATDWAPPDSWGVRPPTGPEAAVSGGMVAPSTIGIDDDIQDFEDYTIDDQDKYQVPRKNFCIRIFRQDGTFGTLQMPLQITTNELLDKLAGKFFLTDMKKYNLILRRYDLDRVLQPHERPLQIQKMLFEQMGYTSQDKIEDVGLEDNSYLLRFVFGPNLAQILPKEPEIPPQQQQQQQQQNQQQQQQPLRHVDLRRRNLTTIPIFLYEHAATLVSLDVSQNLLMEIPVDFAQMCTELRQLSVADNECHVIPLSVKHVGSGALEHLDVSGNRLRDLDHGHVEIHRLTRLISLRARNNRLDHLSPSLESLQQLTTLVISNNAFTTFPDVICTLRALEYLDVSFNKIPTFPEEIGQLTQLESLFAIANRLTGALPPTFVQLEKLRELDIRQNLISDMEVLEHMPGLETLRADYNSVMIVNHGFAQVRRLDMYKNRLTHFGILPPPSPEVSYALSYLNLSNCKLPSLPDDIFTHTPQMETIVLDNNTLNAIPSSVGGLRKLVRLSVQGNQLDSLPPSMFGGLEELHYLDLQKNNLKTLPSEIWSCPKLQSLNCSSNLLQTFPQPFSESGSIITSSSSALAMAAAAESPVHPHHHPHNAGQSALGQQQQQQQQHQEQDIDNGGGGGGGQQQQQQHGVERGASSSNFNPPSFFASPHNHPPPLSLSLRQLFLGDNRLKDDVWSPLSWIMELRTLNLSFNDLTEMLAEAFFHKHLYELYLSGNHLTSLPAEDMEKLSYLRVLAVNGNKLQTIPAEIGKLRKLLTLDVGNNMLKYNISNWLYDWNWNWNVGLRYLNLSGNKRLEIKRTQQPTLTGNGPSGAMNPGSGGPTSSAAAAAAAAAAATANMMENAPEKDLSDFSALTKLRMLGLMDITMLGVSVLEEYHDRRVRTSLSEVNAMGYGVADWLGSTDHLATWDLVMPRFRNRDDECIFGLFDGSSAMQQQRRKGSMMGGTSATGASGGCRLTKFLNDNFHYYLMNELRRSKQDDTIVAAMRRTFLALERGAAVATAQQQQQDPRRGVMMGAAGGGGYHDTTWEGASAVVCYIAGSKLHVANVGDAMAVMSRSNGQAYEVTQKHIALNPSEASRIRAAGGFVSNDGLLNGQLTVSRSFGYLHLIPSVNANPYVATIDLTEDDEFVIMASRGLWERMTYQTAVDIARTEKDDLMAAAQKLRDFAITYGAEECIMVMVIGVGGLFETKQPPPPLMAHPLRTNIHLEELSGKYKRRGIKDDNLGDSTLARLEREVPPPVNHLALVFTDIKNSTQFWETQPENMRSAIKLHDAVMRRALRNVGGYEVKTEGDAFMVCFQSITAALLWCFTVQLQLLEVDWPGGILESEDGREIEKDGIVIYRGLSVRMGIHWGAPVYERNPITNRMDYFGPVVNKASRVSGAADGGQICVSSDVVAALRNLAGVFSEEKQKNDDEEESSNTSDDDEEDEEDVNELGIGGTSSSIVKPYNCYNMSTKEVHQLKRLGFHVVELGERRLKGLETPEILSLVYPKQLAGRIEKNNLISEPTPATATTTTTTTTATTPSPSATTPTPDVMLQEQALQNQDDTTTYIEKRTVNTTIDPALVCALSNLAIRLERVTAGGNLCQQRAGSAIQSQYTSANADGKIVTTATTGLGYWLDRHMKEGASDEELMVLMENFVARVENAASTLYLQKMGQFAGVLEQLGQIIETDPDHILRALQMYADLGN